MTAGALEAYKSYIDEIKQHGVEGLVLKRGVPSKYDQVMEKVKKAYPAINRYIDQTSIMEVHWLVY